jgi:hypothetical protein
MRQRIWITALGLLLWGVGPLLAEVEPLLARIKAVGREGAGNEQAAQAWKQLTGQGPEVLDDILSAMDPDNPIAANWFRTAVDAIAERTLAQGNPLPLERLERFVKQKRHAPAARRIAYELLVREDQKAPERLLPLLVHDPSVELRRDAVAALMGQASQQLDEGAKETAVRTYRKALGGAVDEDQVKQITRQLTELGVKVDIAAHLGFIRSWYLITPFDNTDGVGFATVYAPEKGVDLTASLDGKGGKKIRWSLHATADSYGKVDLNKELGKLKAAVAYACAIVESAEARPVEVRVGSINAVKIFLNGKELFGRDEYHHGMRIDQHIGKGLLKKGRNEVLIKVCQNDQTENWAQNWTFQARLCDSVGAAVPFKLAAEMMSKTAGTDRGE